MLNSMPKPVLEFPVEELSKWEHYNKPQEREALDSLRVKVGFIRAILKEIPAMQIFLKQEKQMVDALEQMYDSTPWQKQQVTQEILNSLDVYSDLKAQVGDFFKTIKVEENRRFFESVYKAKRLESLMHKMMGLSLIVSTGSTVSAWFGAAGIVGFVAVTALDYFKQIQLRRQIRSDIVLPTGILSYSSGQLLNLFINDFEKLRQDYAKLPLPREKNGVKSPFCAVVGGIGKYLFPKMLRQSLTAEVLDANLNNRCEVNAFMESARELALPAPNCL